jgi:predicted GIY-YIG superfamily endonuclease
MSVAEKFYIGFTTNLTNRIVKHNNGEVPHSSKYKPWKIKNTISFDNREKALAFERYLKSHSGRAFAKRHF